MHDLGGPRGVETQCVGRSEGGSYAKIRALVGARAGEERLCWVQSFCSSRLVSAAFSPLKDNESSPASFHNGCIRKSNHDEIFFQRIRESSAIATWFEDWVPDSLIS